MTNNISDLRLSQLSNAEIFTETNLICQLLSLWKSEPFPGDYSVLMANKRFLGLTHVSSLFTQASVIVSDIFYPC